MTINTNHSSALLPVDPRPRLWDNWVALRNGDLTLVDEIVAPVLTVHLPSVGDGPARLRGRGELLSWLSAAHTAHPGLRLTVQVGPIIGPDLVAGRWTCTGLRPGRQPTRRLRSVGTVSGVDIIRIEGDRIVECWSHDDAHAGQDRAAAYAAA
ncbi:nuclear transport factor 2 family protein [Plantactinospora sp. B5E13]|uniref:nuclear transport factor 2 family protein n=1 Tax=unclassified Plantactinospora TaxID=2631981 RepID=UPI00325F4DCE